MRKSVAENYAGYGCGFRLCVINQVAKLAGAVECGALLGWVDHKIPSDARRSKLDHYQSGSFS